MLPAIIAWRNSFCVTVDVGTIEFFKLLLVSLLMLYHVLLSCGLPVEMSSILEVEADFFHFMCVVVCSIRVSVSYQEEFPPPFSCRSVIHHHHLLSRLSSAHGCLLVAREQSWSIGEMFWLPTFIAQWGLFLRKSWTEARTCVVFARFLMFGGR